MRCIGTGRAAQSVVLLTLATAGLCPAGVGAAQPAGREGGAGLPLPTCAEVRASALVGGALADAFYARYPKRLADPRTVGKLPLDRDGLANVVDYLVCVAGLTEFDPVVVENGLALFADRVHGPAATARLAALAQGTGWEANAARTFRTQVRGHLRGPGR
ncbi:hypothetical protein [uncultured Methylobacterium sp.]|jgi:hypothetical protein|uniref:hypothetical protein n=1 Tax=uncultured Methylobacterium sp. TaxID=157278 RepID=UPI00262717E1|nr:hypothetical protein [uncultured Methylobacterium sp.]